MKKETVSRAKATAKATTKFRTMPPCSVTSCVTSPSQWLEENAIAIEAPVICVGISWMTLFIVRDVSEIVIWIIQALEEMKDPIFTSQLPIRIFLLPLDSYAFCHSTCTLLFSFRKASSVVHLTVSVLKRMPA